MIVALPQYHVIVRFVNVRTGSLIHRASSSHLITLYAVNFVIDVGIWHGASHAAVAAFKFIQLDRNFINIFLNQLHLIYSRFYVHVFVSSFTFLFFSCRRCDISPLLCRFFRLAFRSRSN